MKYSFFSSELFCPPSALIIAVSASAASSAPLASWVKYVPERWRGKAPWLSDGRCVKWYRDGNLLYGHHQPKWCAGSRGEKTIGRRERGGWDKWGSGGSKGTTPTEPLRYNSANETLEPWLWPEDVSRRRREWELKMQEAGELLTVNAQDQWPDMCTYMVKDQSKEEQLANKWIRALLIFYRHLTSFTEPSPPVFRKHWRLSISEHVLEPAQVGLIFLLLPIAEWGSRSRNNLTLYQLEARHGICLKKQVILASDVTLAGTQIHGFANWHSHFIMTIDRTFTELETFFISKSQRFTWRETRAAPLYEI